MQTQDPIAIVKNVVEAMNHREMTEVMDYFDDDATLRLEPALPGTAPAPGESTRAAARSRGR